MNDIRETVRARYAAAARSSLDKSSGGCCASTGCCGGTASGVDESADVFGAARYEQGVRAEVGAQVAEASLGCGNPLTVADLHVGDTVLDLGSGAGLDLLLSSRRVGATGKVYGLDMTDEMLTLAQRNIDEAGVTNVELLHGLIEEIPLPDASVDVIISNCVVNLSADKARVFAEMSRVLRPGGRVGITDVVADDELTADERAERGTLVGCVAGALSFGEFYDGLAGAGLVDIDITPTHAVADRMQSATIRATRPG